MPFNRTRRKGDYDPGHVINIGWWAPWNGHEDPIFVQPPIAVLPSYFEEVNDVVGSRGTFNPVKHLVIRSSVKSILPYINIDDANIHINDYPLPLLIDTEELNGIFPLPSPSTLSTWSAEAFNAFHDQVPESFSLANFLYELKDLKGMIPKIEKSMTRTASSNFLAYNFGVAPFVGDVKKMMALTTAIDKRLKHLVETAGKEVRLSFSRALDGSHVPDLIGKQAHPSSQPGATLNFRKMAYSGKFQVTGKLFQKLEILSDPLGGMKAFAAATGFNNPAAIVWEAIPYSFVADWFFSIDKQIDRLAIQPFGGEYRVTDVGWSIKEQVKFSVSQAFYLSHGNTETVLGYLDVQRYQRYPGLPMSSALLTDGTLNPKQLVLGLALLEQRRK